MHFAVTTLVENVSWTRKYVAAAVNATSHYSYLIMGTVASQATNLMIASPTVYSDAGQL